MPLSFENALRLVEELSADELTQLTADDLLYVVSGLTRTQSRDFMFAKNIKIFGGINGYVDNFLSSGTISKIKAMPDGLSKRTTTEGAIESLNKMLTYDELSSSNHEKINQAIIALTNAAAPAAGGYRRKTRKHRNRRNNIKKNRSRIQRSVHEDSIQ